LEGTRPTVLYSAYVFTVIYIVSDTSLKMKFLLLFAMLYTMMECVSSNPHCKNTILQRNIEKWCVECPGKEPRLCREQVGKPAGVIVGLPGCEWKKSKRLYTQCCSVCSYAPDQPRSCMDDYEGKLDENPPKVGDSCQAFMGYRDVKEDYQRDSDAAPSGVRAAVRKHQYKMRNGNDEVYKAREDYYEARAAARDAYYKFRDAARRNEVRENDYYDDMLE